MQLTFVESMKTQTTHMHAERERERERERGGGGGESTSVQSSTLKDMSIIGNFTTVCVSYS